MPYYDYECQQCKNIFEIQKRITDESAETCPKCSSDDTKKVISVTNFQLKGGGWYAAHQSGSKKK